MSDIYRLDDLNGWTVGKDQDFDTFAEVIDYLRSKDSHQIGFDEVIDELDECPTDENGIYDEDEAKDICLRVFDGEDIDDEDPEAEWGDEMYCRAAGK